MAWDARIRPIGRPTVTKDSLHGFQRVRRKFVVEGPAADKASLEGTDGGTAIFRPVGEADVEFTDHYLVNQTLEPGSSVDKAYLTQEFAEIRSTWVSESIAESSVKKLTRKYIVLKNSNTALAALTPSTPALGYADGPWALHPVTGPETPDNNDPWDLLPKIISDTEPEEDDYQDLGGAAHHAVSVTTAYVYVCLVDSYVTTRSEATVTITDNAAIATTVLTLTPYAGSAETYTEGTDFTAGGTKEDSATALDTAINTQSSGFQSIVSGAVLTITSKETGDNANDSTVSTTHANTDIVNFSGGSETVDVTVTNKLAFRVGTHPGGLTTTLESASPAYYPGGAFYVNATNDGTVSDSDLRTPLTLATTFVDSYAVTSHVASSTYVSEVGGTSTPLDEYFTATMAALTDPLKWLRGSASIDTSNPGLDIWTVSWVAPVTPFWSTGAGTQGIKPPAWLSFDHNGLKLLKPNAVNGSQSARFTFFIVGKQIPFDVSGALGVTPSVSLDFSITGKEDSGKTHSFKQSFSNTMFVLNTDVHLKFPSYLQVVQEAKALQGIQPAVDDTKARKAHIPGWPSAVDTYPGIEVATYDPFTLIFDYLDTTEDSKNLPSYQNSPITKTGGHISWSHNYAIGSGTPSKTDVTPLFSHNDERIWKIDVYCA